VLIPGLLGYGVLLGSLPLATHPLWLGFWSLAIGGGAGFVADLPTALIGDRVAPPWQGVAIGWLRTMTDADHILGPLGLGALADAVHLAAPFLLAGGLVSAFAWRCSRLVSPAPPGPTPQRSAAERRCAMNHGTPWQRGGRYASISWPSAPTRTTQRWGVGAPPRVARWRDRIGLVLRTVAHMGSRAAPEAHGRGVGGGGGCAPACTVPEPLVIDDPVRLVARL
jgi:hypothetical protein